MSEQIQQFRIDIPQADLDDLIERLRRTRWADELPADQRGSGQPGGPDTWASSTTSPATSTW